MRHEHVKNFDRAAPVMLPGLFVPKKPAVLSGKFRDALFTYDSRTIDSTGVFLNNELERLDLTLHAPLVSVTWSRDIDLREDVSMGDEQSSFTNSSFAAMGGIVPGGIAWISKDANAISGVALDIGKTLSPLPLWGMELKWTLPELASAQQLGRSVDEQKYAAMKLKYNMDVDQITYKGDNLTYGSKGIFNQTGVTPSNVASVNGSTLWTNKSPEEILVDVNEILHATWANAAWAVMPNRLMVPPFHFSYLSSQMINVAGDRSILKYLNENNVVTQAGGQLEILPQKWLVGLGAGSTDRMCAYTKDRERIRLPIVPLQRTPLEYRSLYQITTYYGRIGVIELVYSETVSYRDGI